MKKYNLAYFVSHPIQYQAPMLRMLAERPEVDLKVFFVSDFSLKDYEDKGFGRKIEWDVPLVDGYEHAFLPRLIERGTRGFFDPFVGGIRSALTERKWDAVWFHGYAHHALLWGIMLASKMGLPIFFRSESNLTCTSGGHIKDAFIRWLVGKASALLWVSTVNKEYYLHYGARKDQLFFTPYAVDNDFFRDKMSSAGSQAQAIREQLALSEDIPVILFASKWIKRKNPLLLLDAFARLRDKGAEAYLLYVGDGELRDEMKMRVAELNLDKYVKLLGFKNQTELPGYYALCDVFVLPSNKEPFGLVINEVMNAGKAVITTDEVGAAKDLVRDGVNGFVVPAGDKDVLTEALVKILSDQNNITQMGQESLKLIADWNYAADVRGVMGALEKEK
jgi:glycosyltransferase involved in cell wall biosynthesis